MYIWLKKVIIQRTLAQEIIFLQFPHSWIENFQQ